MGKIYQVRYTVSDTTVAHEHYTEKGAKVDAKQLSKVIGNAMLGEIEVADNGEQTLVRVWEYSGGETGKPIIKEPAPPSPVKIVKTAEETKLLESKVEKKEKAPKLSDEERIAAKKKEYEDGLAAIAAGTYVLPVRGRKPTTGEPRARKVKPDIDKVSKMKEVLHASEETAKILAEIGVTTVSRRAKVAVEIMDNKGPIFASHIVDTLNEHLEESEEKLEIKEVMACVNHINWLFTRFEQSWLITVKEREGGDKRFNFVPVKIEYEDPDEEDKNTGEASVA